MASLRKRIGSPYWVACYYDAHRNRVQRSTEQTNRKTAQAVADKLEKAAKLAAEQRLGEAAARKLIGEIYEAVAKERLPLSSTRDFLTCWIEGRKADTSPRTHAAYAQNVRDFLASLGPRADLDVSQVSKSDVAKFRDGVLRRTSAASANKAVKLLRVALGAAHKGGFAQDNPAAKIDTLRRTAADRQQRRPFTHKELRLIIDAASNEWRGIIAFGLYTGQRLGDIARLTWNNIDTTRNELRFTTAKTGRNMIIPLAAPLLSYVESLDAGDNPAAPLFPKAAAEVAKSGKAAVLSKQFHALLVSVGLAAEWKSTGTGRNGARTLSPLSFHSLRHTATSLLKNAGVSEIVARDIIGHDSEAVSRNYSHVDEDMKRASVAKLPDLLTASAASKEKGARVGG